MDWIRAHPWAFFPKPDRNAIDSIQSIDRRFSSSKSPGRSSITHGQQRPSLDDWWLVVANKPPPPATKKCMAQHSTHAQTPGKPPCGVHIALVKAVASCASPHRIDRNNLTRSPLPHSSHHSQTSNTNQASWGRRRSSWLLLLGRTPPRPRPARRPPRRPPWPPRRTTR